MTMTHDTTDDGQRIPLELRSRHVATVTWTDDDVVFTLTPSAKITVGRGALFTPEPYETAAPRTSLGQTPPSEVEQVIGAEVRASAAWTSGTMRIVFARPTRHLTVIRGGMFVPVTIERDGQTIWTRPERSQ
jgi:hypothetical protein